MPLLRQVFLQVYLAERQQKDQVYTWTRTRQANELPIALADSTGFSSVNEAGRLESDDLDALDFRSIDSYYDVQKIRGSRKSEELTALLARTGNVRRILAFFWIRDNSQVSD
jgi:hypothetical protein